MGKNLRDFANIKFSTSNEKENIKNEENTKQSKQENLKDIINTYQQKSNSELREQLFQEVAKQKENGTFDAVKLERMLDGLGGLLTDEQKKNVKELLNQIK